MKQHSDAQLVSLYLKGNEEAFKFLAERYLKLVYSISWQYAENKAAAEDITQEAFIKAWKNLSRFDQGKSFKAWIAKIAKNTGLDHVKKKQAIPFSLLPGADAAERIFEPLFGSVPALDEEFDRDLMIRKFSGAMEDLAPETRDVFSSRLETGETFRHIASKTGESLNTVKSRYRRGIIYLKKLLSE